MVDFSNSKWTGGKDVQSAGVISGYRHGLFSRDMYRLVFDLKQPSKIERSFALQPNKRYGHRYVIDLTPVGARSFEKAVQASQEQRRSTNYAPPQLVEFKSSKDRKSKPLIVIDAGHGGPDPGTIGVGKVKEKNPKASVAVPMTGSFLNIAAPIMGSPVLESNT